MSQLTKHDLDIAYQMCSHRVDFLMDKLILCDPILHSRAYKYINSEIDKANNLQSTLRKARMTINR